MADGRPASRLEVFDITAPAGTPRSAPIEVDTPWMQGDLLRVEIMIPPGHAGLTGIQLAVAHGQAIPFTRGAWLVGNGETLAYDVAGFVNTGAWSAFVYNADVLDHVFHVRYAIADFFLTGSPPEPPPLPTPLIV